MPNIIQRFLDRHKFPKIDWGHKFEGIEYKTETQFLYIDSTFLGGRKIYTDSIKTWSDGQPISQNDKGKLFGEIIAFVNRNSKEKPVIIINVDYGKVFWENVCRQNENLVKEIQYDSNKQKEDFKFN